MFRNVFFHCVIVISSMSVDTRPSGHWLMTIGQGLSGVITPGNECAGLPIGVLDVVSLSDRFITCDRMDCR